MKKIFTVLTVLFMALALVGCQTASTVNQNLRNQEANFQVYRKVTVINLRSDKILLEVEGYLHIKIDADGDLNVTILTAPGQYMLHYASLGEGVVYVSEQTVNSHTDPYHWEIRIFAIVPDVQLGRN